MSAAIYMLHQSQDRGSALTFLPFLFNQLRRSLQVSCKSCEKSSIESMGWKSQDLDIDSIGDISKAARACRSCSHAASKLFCFCCFCEALEQGKLRLEAQTPNFEASWQADVSS